MVPFRKDELVRIKVTYSAGFPPVGFVASVNFLTGRCRIRGLDSGRFFYRTLSKRQLGVILRQLGSSGLFDRELVPVRILDDTGMELVLFYGDGTSGRFDYLCDADVDWRFVDTIERYLGGENNP